MKKICFITTVSITLKSFVVETAKYLHEQCGWDITLICNMDEEFAKSLPSYLHYIPVPMERGVNFAGFKAIDKLKSIFIKEKFDAVQYATPNASFYASIAAKAAKIPIRLYCQWGIRYVGFAGIKRTIFKILEKEVCKNSTHIFAVSPLNMQFAIAEKLYKEEKAQVVGNGGTIGVDCTVFDIQKKPDWRKRIRKELALNEDDFVFGFSGRIGVDKGCKELFTAFQTIHKNKPKAKLLLVGPLDENCGLDKEMIEWVTNCPSIYSTGFVENKKMREYYAAMDVLVHPTYREGFGMVIQEAGALAVPVITTNIPGASEVMEENISCVLVNAKDTKDLQETMENLFMNPQKVKKMGSAAYERTLTRYERNIMLLHQKAAYKNLLGE